MPITYHGASGAQHQQYFDQYSAQGLRPISLSVYDDPAAPLYAAVWDQIAGPQWTAVHGLDAAGYQQAFDTNVAQGLRPIIVTVTASGSSQVFAAVFDASPAPGWVARHDLVSGDVADSSTIEYWTSNAGLSGLIPRWIASYGDPGALRYAGIWEPKAAGLGWDFQIGLSAADHQARFSAQTAANGRGVCQARPAFVTVAPGEAYTSVYRDDEIGPFLAYHAMTAADWQSIHDHASGQGYSPICLQAAGTGDAVRFAAILGTQQSPYPARTQPVISGQGDPAFQAIDTAISSFMSSLNFRCGSVAIAKDGQLKYARAFTAGDTSYPAIDETARFRLASSSKLILSVAIHQLMDRTDLPIALTPATKVQDVLGLTPYNGTVGDDRLAAITIGHLLTHTAGFNDGAAATPKAFNGQSGDPLFMDSVIAAAVKNDPAGLPITLDDVASYMWAQALPLVRPASGTGLGVNWSYSNFGFSLLSLVVRKLTGLDYRDYVAQRIWAPLGISRAQIGASLLGACGPNDVFQHEDAPAVSSSVVSGDRPLVADAYGGWNMDVIASIGGWVAAPSDMVKMLTALQDTGYDRGISLMQRPTRNTMWQNAGVSDRSDLCRGGWYQRTRNNTVSSAALTVTGHNGSLPGTATLCWVRSDGFAVAAVFNHDVPGYLQLIDARFADPVNAAIDAVTTWPVGDRFPQVGLPPLPPPHLQLPTGVVIGHPTVPIGRGSLSDVVLHR